MGRVIDESLEEFDDFNHVVKLLYTHLWGEKFPSDWKIYAGVQGTTLHELKSILLAASTLAHDEDVASVVHELIHMRHPEWEHDGTFHAEENAMLEKAIAWFTTHCHGCGEGGKGSED